MKHVILTLLAFFALGAMTSASAQCTVENDTFSEPGLYPDDSNLECFVRGKYHDRTIVFKNFDSIQALGTKVSIEYVIIDSVNNMPCGLRWTTDKQNSPTPNKFQSGETGCIKITGTVDGSEPTGQYQLEIVVTADVGLLPGDPDTTVRARDIGLSYYVRAKDSGNTCTNIDTSQSSEQACRPSTEWTNIDQKSSISAIQQLNVSPNPFTSSTSVSFTAEHSSTYDVGVYSLLGKQVRHRTIDANAGKNEFTLSRGDLSSGMYILNVTNNQGEALSEKMIIGDNR